MTDSDVSVTPYDVSGEVDYERLLEQFGADSLTDDQIKQFPSSGHRLLSRRVFYAGRDVDAFTEAIHNNEEVSVVTGRGPSGPMHLGHIIPFYFAKYLQEAAGAHVYIPISNDEKYLNKQLSASEITQFTEENIRQILGVGFEPKKTTVIRDFEDADVVYPVSVHLSKNVTPATKEAVYGTQSNIGMEFYPAVQATHLLLPQLIEGMHRTTVPIAVDQDPHIRLARDIAAKEKYQVFKPGALLSKFLPTLDGPGKMSSSDDNTTIYLTDDSETVEEKIMKYAHSGGQKSLEEHRKHGGDPASDVSFQYLHSFFEEDDDEVERLRKEYERGEVTSGEMKQRAADSINSFLSEHQKNVSEVDSFEPFLLSEEEKTAALNAVGFTD